MSNHILHMAVASADANSAAGIYSVHLDATSGAMHLTGETAALETCLYLNRHPIKPVLYATGTCQGEACIQALHIQPDGSLIPINRQPTNGLESCYIATTRDSRYALVANYRGPAKHGSIGSFPLNADGHIQPQADWLQLAGSSSNPQRQEAAHPHMIVTTPDDQFVLVPDLGTDQVRIYRLDQASGQFQSHTQPHIEIQNGSGPRHLTFHPTQPFIYLLSELQPVLTVIAYDAQGHFEVIGTYPTLPPDADARLNQGADIHITPSGQFLYVSNRGHNTIGVFTVDASGKQLVSTGHFSCLGDWPRAFALDPTGQMLIVANRRTNDVHVFRINEASGQLETTGHRLSIPAPVSLHFMGDPGSAHTPPGS